MVTSPLLARAGLRVSTAFFLLKAETDHLLAALSRLQRS